uniref:Uncharacterized protein n=1 Tax=Manihot esculenta TaxID=3983 RepID=A0A2C9U049_MANES
MLSLDLIIYWFWIEHNPFLAAVDYRGNWVGESLDLHEICPIPLLFPFPPTSNDEGASRS